MVRPYKYSPDPDVSKYMPLVAEFLRAAAKDFHYAEAISATASKIERKRKSLASIEGYTQLSGSKRPPRGWTWKNTLEQIEMYS